ncbi:hypothetical protein NPIL_112251 [Nephila pilipes]|uniref:Uncharacterized protein n=1 Tax=Nephila pilipes TaxID=299642 RepID=A0A8X6IH32_NEPPI|nr:hypothetical protein NPIL_112251 [Nephila pilipes]
MSVRAIYIRRGILLALNTWTPAQFCRNICNHLNASFDQEEIDRCGPVHRPLGSVTYNTLTTSGDISRHWCMTSPLKAPRTWLHASQ